MDPFPSDALVLTPIPTIPQLPVEIWEQVIDFIATWYGGQKDLLSYALVCQAWCDRARLDLYGNIIIEVAQISKFLSA